ncbi:hypothetical protein Pan110_15270 [Gimesia panareensis]|nr:hypothetical protein Pan110_15270 [Gimesia panareensis]
MNGPFFLLTQKHCFMKFSCPLQTDEAVQGRSQMAGR